MALTFNPDGTTTHGGRSLAEIIAAEEYLDNEPPPIKNEEGETKKKMKFLNFELDMTYPRTLKGFFRILQVLLLFVAFICLVITASWPSSGVYSFYCVMLIFSTLISGFLFFTVLAGIRKKTLCGFAWIKVELIYFALFGFIVFIGACLAASNSDGNPALNAGAAFGFLAFVTFAAHVFWTWKEYKNPPEDPDETDKEDKDEQDISDSDSKISNNENNGELPRSNGMRKSASMIDPPINQNGDFRIDVPVGKEHSGNFGQTKLNRGMNDQTRSLERPLSIVSRGNLIDPPSRRNPNRRSVHRRQPSGSDKDSAYSEGSMNDRDRSLPAKLRRTASARGDERRGNTDERRKHHQSGERRPQELSAEFFGKDDGRQRKPVPGWLKAALDCDNESEIAIPRHTSAMPSRRNEFPLLPTSDEESVAYPSVSQNYGDGEKFGPPVMKSQRQFAREGDQQRSKRGQAGRNIFHSHKHRHHAGQGNHGRGAKRFHHHSGRHTVGHGRMHFHGNHRGQHGRRGGRNGRLHHYHRGHDTRHDIRPHNQDLLRRMVENDRLVNQNGHMHSEMDKGKRRMFPEQPSSIHFPEKSRWDDNDPALPEDYGGPGNMIEKYLNE